MTLAANDDGRSAREKMLAGELHLAPDPELIAMGNRARALTREFNAIPREQVEERVAILKQLFGRFGRSWIESPFTVDYGVHVEIGEFSYVNVNCTFLDSARIAIGDRVLIGPGVQLITASHPVEPEARTIDYLADPAFPFRAVSFARPITIGDDVWIGAGAIILPGVTIGSGTTVGAGSVVTRSLPENVVAVGNPARVIRQLDGAKPDAAERLALAS
jgi:maltose O-acetyltransferase